MTHFYNSPQKRAVLSGTSSCTNDLVILANIIHSAPSQPKKAIVEHSVRLSFHNDLPKSEGSGENSPKTTVKHHAKTLFMVPERTQSGISGSKNLLPSKCLPKTLHEAKTVVGKSLIVGSEKLTDDKTPESSVDFTQLTVLSDGNDKQSSKTLTESTTKEARKQMKEGNALKSNKASQEALTQNISIRKGLGDTKRKGKQNSEVEESESVGEKSTVSASVVSTEDPKQSGRSQSVRQSPSQPIQPG
ncbi:hypothetical protein LOAG_06417 [Loa loa]|uniref:BRCA2-interacting transcriptional repressor EMSY n=1 Tax=Loa loa TaxID=7209 RepID=A0A1I7VYZ1_LOALO|nr:hypothetical protein LOAG_06417 [Loa loa]EFO22067.1 hypothetical protein LOAG_06417 [Loa loa]